MPNQSMRRRLALPYGHFAIPQGPSISVLDLEAIKTDFGAKYARLPCTWTTCQML